MGLAEISLFKLRAVFGPAVWCCHSIAQSLRTSMCAEKHLMDWCYCWTWHDQCKPCQPWFNSNASIWLPAPRLMSAHQPCKSFDDETQCHRDRKCWHTDRDTSSSTCCHRTNAFNLANSTGTKGIGHADSLQEWLHKIGMTQGMEEDGNVV